MLSGYVVYFFFAVLGDNTVKTMLGSPPPPEKYLLFLVFIFEISRLSFSLPSQNYSNLVNYNSFIFLPLLIICQIAHLFKKKKKNSEPWQEEEKKQSYPTESFAWILLAVKIATYWLKRRTKTNPEYWVWSKQILMVLWVEVFENVWSDENLYSVLWTSHSQYH